MSWEYRVVRIQTGDLFIMPVNGNARFTGTIHGKSLNDLENKLKEIATAIDKPILEERDGKLVEVVDG